MSISVKRMKKLLKDDYQIIDIRSAAEIAHGEIPGAVIVAPENVLDNKNIDYSKKLIICCARGEKSEETARLLQSEGYDAQSLEGGFGAWLLDKMSMTDENEKAFEVEKSLRKKFRKEIWSKFTKAVNTYELVKPGDKIAVCISGGKDSMLMAKCFQELKLHDKFDFDVKFLVMDPGYSPRNRQVIEENARILNIPIIVFESDIFESVYNIEKSPCYLCARMRRGYLYSHAKELGCNKIALGHHFDDVIETILMGMLYSGKVETMMPKLHSQNFEGMELIRPMYLIKESAIKAWRDTNGLHFIQCACRFTENCVSCGGGRGSKRDEMKELVAQFRNTSSVIETNIFNSVRDINLRTVMGYHKDGEYYNFLDDYDQRGNKGKKEDLPEDSLMQENPAEERKESDQAE